LSQARCPHRDYTVLIRLHPHRLVMRAVGKVEKVGSPSKDVARGPSASPFASDTLGLSFYQEAPDVEVTIREFEELACDRLKVLHAFDRHCGFDMHMGDVRELGPKLRPELVNSRLALSYPSLAAQESSFPAAKAEFCRRDILSHFVLRLAFCRSREARDWFMKQEQRLFVLRFDGLRLEAKEALLRSCGVPCKRFEQPADGSGISLRQLQACTADAKIWSDNRKPDFDRVFYEFPFHEVHPSLIAARRVVVRGGKAFVPSSVLWLILVGKFKQSLAEGLEAAFHGLPAALADPRIGGFVRLLQEHGLQLLVAPKSNAEDPGEKLSVGNFEEFLVRSFPPCMRRLVEHQREQKKHLKHQGRLQLRPFLKDAGLSYDESVRWWRQELLRDREIDSTVFEKNYTYDVDHTYGKKGHMQGQNTCGCPKIVGYPGEAAGQAHGCPFKQLDVRGVKELMYKWRLPEKHINEVEKLVTNGNHYQLACIEYFRGTHAGSEGDGVGNAPMDFFRESCRYHVQKREKAGAAGSPEKSATA